jgi:uncharacterized membrane protein YdbT with pleckstrin-like domain
LKKAGTISRDVSTDNAEGERVTAYIELVLQPDERVVAIGKLHRMMYILPVLLILCGFAAAGAGFAYGPEEARIAGAVVGAILFIVGFVGLIRAVIRRRSTEIAVTDRRIVYKTGVLRRHTVEMNMNRVESVVVDQTLTGRLFNFGTIHIRGVGVGIEDLAGVSHPLDLRNAIIAR